MLYLGSMLSSCLLSMAVVSLMNLFVGRYESFLNQAYLSGLVNLSSRNRLRDRFFGSKSTQDTGQRFSGTNFRQESITGF
jgi:hypothetical protein